MIIGIDGNEANEQSRVGVNQYAYELLWNFKKLVDQGETSHSFIIYLKNAPLDLPKEGKNWKYIVIPGKGMWIIKKLFPRLLLGKDKIDLFFSPSHYLPPLSRVPQVCSIMDLGYLKFPEQLRRYDYWQLRLWSAWSIFISNILLTISKATQVDIHKNYPHASKKTRVTLLAGDTSVSSAKVSGSDMTRTKKKYGIGGEFVLFLGTLKPSKNIEGLIKAWSRVNKEGTKLVIAGKKGWLFDSIFELVKKLKVEESVIFTDFIDDIDKPSLVKSARVFVLPSFWEGFGIDVLNAYTLGVPVIVSRRGSLPEVAGDVGIYIDPDDPQEIATAIERVLLMGDKEYNKLSRACEKQAKKFSWETTARETLKIMTNV